MATPDAVVRNAMRAINAELKVTEQQHRKVQSTGSRAYREIGQDVDRYRRKVRSAEQQQNRMGRSLRGIGAKGASAIQSLTGISGVGALFAAAGATALGAWDKFLERIERAEPIVKSLVFELQQVLSGGGLEGQSREIRRGIQDISSGGFLSPDELVRALGSFKGTAKNATTDQSLAFLRRANLAFAAGLDPTQLASATGALVEEGVGVERASNLAATFVRQGGRDAAPLLDSLQFAVRRLGPDQADEVAALLLGAGNRTEIRKVRSEIDKLTRGGDFQGDIISQVGLAMPGILQATSRELGGIRGRNASIEAFAANTLSNNPEFQRELALRREENELAVDRARKERTVLEKRLEDVEHERLLDESGIARAAASIPFVGDRLLRIGTAARVGNDEVEGLQGEAVRSVLLEISGKLDENNQALRDLRNRDRN